MGKVTALNPDKRITSERLSKFIDLYLDYKGDHRQAFLDAGYAEGGIKSAMSILRQNWAEVEKRIRLRIGTHVPMALNVVVELAENGKQESIRLKAAQDLMSRAGYDKANELIITERNPDELKNDELETELTALLKRSREAGEKSA